ncbi:nitrilase-related carbon-nitrogen hydrolase [Haloimpatiens sp. FM7315]|uniref:nitrilase-related carbon-nitrogen hydrolase n=1 Tax=Haloimpatiens sp. FM7315 TaxID=3298609 RepID=UPI0035A3192E
MKLALAQMKVVFENKEFNMKACEKFIIEAKRRKVDLIVFPEMTLTGYSMKVSRIGDRNFETLNFFEEFSKAYNISIGVGYVNTEGKLGKNMFTIIDKYGKSLCSYCKIHPFSYAKEDEFYEKGENICFANVEDICITPFICYDLRFPEIFQLASKKARLITVSANWPQKRKEHWITLLKSRAIENQCYVAGVNIVGEAGNEIYSGNSMIVDPSGNIISTLENSEGLIVSDIYEHKVRELRGEFKLKDDRREDLYYSFYHHKV